MPAPVQKSRNTGKNATRNGRKTVIQWVSNTGYVAGSAFKFTGFECDIEGMDNIPLALKDEREIMDVGKNPVMVNNGLDMQPFNLTIRGNSVRNLGVFTNKDLTVAGTRALVHEGDYGRKGHLIIHSWSVENSSPKLMRSDLITDVSVKILEVPGVQNGDSTYNIQFYNTNPVIWTVGSPLMFAAEMWYEGGAVVNADAPDGADTTFVLGTGNQSYLSPTTPAAVDLDSRKSNWRRYLPVVQLDGVDQDDTAPNPAFNAGTSTLTFTTAPAAASKLLVIYAVDTDSFQPANMRTDLYPSAAYHVNGGLNQSCGDFQTPV